MQLGFVPAFAGPFGYVDCFGDEFERHVKAAEFKTRRGGSNLYLLLSRLSSTIRFI